MPLQSATNPETFQDHIAQAMLRLVADRGTDEVTTMDVIRAMGTTDAALARYCPTESDLWRITIAFVERGMAGLGMPSCRANCRRPNDCGRCRPSRSA